MVQARFLLMFGLMLLSLGSSGLRSMGQQPVVHPLPSIEIKAGSATIRAEVARSSEEKATGLMYRTRLADNAGMIFVLDGKNHASFWMKNTSIPLSVAFVDVSGTILEIVDMQPYDERSVISASDRVAFALEMNQHWFSLNRVKAGDRLQLVGKNWNAFFRADSI